MDGEWTENERSRSTANCKPQMNEGRSRSAPFATPSAATSSQHACNKELLVSSTAKILVHSRVLKLI